MQLGANVPASSIRCRDARGAGLKGLGLGLITPCIFINSSTQNARRRRRQNTFPTKDAQVIGIELGGASY